MQSWRNFKYGPLLVLRYEDMLEQPKTTFRGLLDFLGWDDDDAALDAALDAVMFDKLKQAETESGFAEAAADRPFFRRGVAGGWRDHPEQDQFRRLEEAFGSIMTAYGFR